MTGLVARVVMWLGITAVLLVAGAFFLRYILDWQWARAGIAGLAFVGASVVAATFVFVSRMLRVERRLDELLVAVQALGSSAQRPGGGQDLRLPGGGPVAQDGEPAPDFPWLRTPTGLPALGLFALAPYQPPRSSVFIPIFLTAGLAISAVAGIVERIAAGRPRRPPPAADPLPTAHEVLGARPRWTLVLVPLAVLLVIVLGIGGLWWGGHYRSQPLGPGLTAMTVQVDSRGPTTSAADVVETLGRFCAIQSGVGIRFREVRPRPGGSVTLRVSPLLDEAAQERYVGCLEDAVLEFHELTVTRTALEPR